MTGFALACPDCAGDQITLCPNSSGDIVAVCRECDRTWWTRSKRAREMVRTGVMIDGHVCLDPSHETEHG